MAVNLRDSAAAVRLLTTWMGARKALSAAQNQKAAEPFEAEGNMLSASKRLFNTKAPPWRNLCAIRTECRNYWYADSLPWIEDGIRLVPKSRLDAFLANIDAYALRLDGAVAEFQAAYPSLREEAKGRLGALFNAGDYPESVVGLFGIEREIVSVEPPNYLKELNPAEYDKQMARVQAKFDTAVTLAEQAFTEEFAKLVGHLCERLTGKDDEGKAKRFAAANIDNLRQFFGRFKALNPSDNAELDGLIAKAQDIVAGIEPQQLRDDVGLKAGLAAKLGEVSAALDKLMESKPRRMVDRPAPEAA